MSSRLIKTRSNEFRCLGLNIIDTRGKHCPPLSKECIYAIHKLMPYSQVIHLSDPIDQLLANAKDVSTTTPVYEFLQHGGCDTSEVDVEHDNLLHLASVGGLTEVMIELLDKNLYDINVAGLEGRTPALMAAFCGNKRILELLVDKQCNMSAVDRDTLNVLHIAITKGHLDIVKYILSLGVDKESRIMSTGQTPLILASLLWEYEYVLKFLVDYGCDLTAVDSKHNNALHAVARGESATNIQYLISLGVEKDHVNSDGYTPLMIAAQFSKKDNMEILVNNGCNTKVAHIYASKWNVLHVSAIQDVYDVLQYALTLGIDIDSKTSRYRTALMLAALFGTMNTTKLLVDSGASLTALSNEGCDVMYYAAYAGEQDIVKYLKSRGVAITGSSRCLFSPLEIAKTNNRVNLLDILRVI